MGERRFIMDAGKMAALRQNNRTEQRLVLSTGVFNAMVFQSTPPSVRWMRARRRDGVAAAATIRGQALHDRHGARRLRATLDLSAAVRRGPRG